MDEKVVATKPAGTQLRGSATFHFTGSGKLTVGGKPPRRWWRKLWLPWLFEPLMDGFLNEFGEKIAEWLFQRSRENTALGIGIHQ